MEVIAWSENLTAERGRARRARERVERDELFARADVLTIHTRAQRPHPRAGRRARARR